jgi:hypothetical protein
MRWSWDGILGLLGRVSDRARRGDGRRGGCAVEGDRHHGGWSERRVCCRGRSASWGMVGEGLSEVGDEDTLCIDGQRMDQGRGIRRAAWRFGIDPVCGS